VRRDVPIHCGVRMPGRIPLSRRRHRGERMDPATLAAAAASGLVAALTTDAWEQARSAIVGLWRRVHPNRAETIEDELAEVREEALAARQQGDADTEEGLIADWQRRLRRLLEADPEIAAELQRVLDDVFTPALDSADQQRIGQIVMKAQATGHGRVFQAGRDMHVTGQ
jgi:hypothetical protein